jgi:hypothetical protein
VRSLSSLLFPRHLPRVHSHHLYTSVSNEALAIPDTPGFPDAPDPRDRDSREGDPGSPTVESTVDGPRTP